METIKFNKTECGVDFLLNVLPSDEIGETYLNHKLFNTDYFEIIFFKKGSGQLTLNYQKINVEDNSIIFISPFQKRQWKLDAEDFDFTVLAFKEDFLNEFFSDKLFTYRLSYFYQLEFPLNMQVEKENIDMYCVLLSEIKAELRKTRIDSVHIIRSLIYYLLQKLNRVYAEKHQLSLKNQDTNYAFQFKKLIETNIENKQRISDYTDLMGISRITLNKCVKDQFNVTATHLLKQRLLVEIKDYLIHSEMTVSQIAYKLNISEPNHLMRFFKSQTGMTTTEFLADYQNGSIA
ncbi:helix-turn-helix domain-containing protein [Chryseobacterium bernardetii]|uniref:Helix-turn-helix domain-containing protein n=1 Tax=Chryseobacterium bernardetii TaxID=1241978 RepID=A0A3G6TAX1_9FLAO|nr:MULTISPECIES: AraC family transcriptional regulator [Bacteroidota]AZB23424.1 helix-turn-helix domain-containing protein [Chryseobacterium bernardetii]QBQ41786.1 helix-turn-helix domain-containing protein [Sphingobacterium psychroaquaticum]